MSQDLISAILTLIPFGVIGAIRFGAWVIKLILSSRWHDIKATGELPYSRVGVAVTVKGEPPATFQMVLESLLREQLDQVCITFDQGEHDNMAVTERFAKEHAGEIDIRWEIVTEKGKRKGLKAAITMVEGMDIIICMDSDTIFGDGVKRSILDAFSKPGIGGVTVKQRVYQPQTIMHYLFDIRLKLRYHIEAPGQALSGNLSCLSGRCSAYLAEPLKTISAMLVNESWLGIRKTGGGEDKCLTTFLQDAGYKCAVVVDSVVYTRPESNINVYVSQSLRWARNSWFSDLRAIFQRKPWMVRNPIMLFYTLDRMMSTFTLALAIWYMSILLLTHHFLGAGILVLWWIISRGIKIFPYLTETGHWWVVPPYAIFSIFLSIIKIHALVTLWETGWLTRGSAAGGSSGGDKARIISKSLLTNTYRGITAGIMVMLGVVAFRSEDVWLADIPGVAEAGHFYRPGETGLHVMQTVFDQQRTTYVALADPTNLDVLNAALPDVARMGEELARQADFIHVVQTSSLTEKMVDVSNLVVIGVPSADGPLTGAITGIYNYPGQGERLMNAEPFAEGVDNPIRIAHAPWDERDWVVLAGEGANQRYRLRGQILNEDDARVVMERELGSAYFQPLSVDRQKAVRLQHLDNVTIDAAAADETDLLHHDYILIATDNIDLSQLTFSVEGDALSLLTDGAELSIALNQTHVGTLKIDKSATQPAKLSLSIAAEIVAADPEEPLIVSVSFPTAAVSSSDSSDSLLWEQLEAYSLIEWQEKKSDTINLASYPFPYLSMQESVPTAIIIPDSPSESELNQLIQLVAFLGANGHPVDKFRVMTPATLNLTILESSNVIVLGSVERQRLSQVLSTQANQTVGIGVQSVLPTLESGLIWLSVSPWNPDHHLVVATGVTESASIRASRALERTTLLVNRPVMGAIIRPDGAVVPFGGFDHLALPNSITDVTVANAAIPGDHSQ